MGNNRRNSMSIREFIKQNKTEIDKVIRERCPNAPKLNDEDRRQWILNDEYLYNTARGQEVNI